MSPTGFRDFDADTAVEDVTPLKCQFGGERLSFDRQPGVVIVKLTALYGQSAAEEDDEAAMSPASAKAFAELVDELGEIVHEKRAWRKALRRANGTKLLELTNWIVEQCSGKETPSDSPGLQASNGGVSATMSGPLNRAS